MVGITTVKRARCLSAVYLFRQINILAFNYNFISDNIVYSSELATCFGFTKKPLHVLRFEL
jgi:hypothetical protein